MTEAPADIAHWSRVARDWTAWARKPGHDAFWSYRAGLATLIRPGPGASLDIGCGEGRVSRELQALGYHVTAVDPVAEMVAAARQAGSADAYVVAPANALPFADAHFDLVVAYNVLMDVEDLPGALAEMRRVVRPDGRLLISIVHPLQDRGGFDGDGPEARFVLDANWFEATRFEGRDERDGLVMDFAGWSRPLDAYAAALADAGLAITDLREPQPDTGAPPSFSRAFRVPIFLWLVCRPYPR